MLILLLPTSTTLLLQVMFSQLVESVVHTPALVSFMDVLCKGTSGAAAADIPAAYMVRAFAEMYQPGGPWTWAGPGVGWAWRCHRSTVWLQ